MYSKSNFCRKDLNGKEKISERQTCYNMMKDRKKILSYKMQVHETKIGKWVMKQMCQDKSGGKICVMLLH